MARSRSGKRGRAVANVFADFQALTLRLASGELGDTVEFLLDQMEPESASCLRLCAIPHQFDASILQILNPHLTAERAAALCDEFAQLQIITFNPDGMALHDEGRRQLFQQWIGPPTDPAFTEASQRLADHFTSAAIAQTGVSAKDILTTARMFHLLGADQIAGFEEFQRLCRLKRREFRLDDCEHLISLSHEYDSVLTSEHRQWLAYHEGKLAADRCNWERAQEIFKGILKSEPLELRLAINATNRLGMVLDEKRDYSGAIEAYQKALALATQHRDGEDFVYKILADLGAAHRDSGDLDEAEKLLERSINLASKQNDDSSIAVGYNSLGTLYRRKQEPWKAIKAYEQSLSHLDELHDKLRRAQVHNNLGVAYRELGKWKESKTFFEKSRDIACQIGDTAGHAKTLNNLMVVYRNLGDNSQAIESAQKAIKLFEEMHDTFSVATTRRNLGRLYRRMKWRDEAALEFGEAIRAFEHCKAIDEVVETRIDLERLGEKTGGLAFWIIVVLIAAFLVFLFFLVLSRL